MSDKEQYVWVIMGNDFPDSVFNNEDDADAYVNIMSKTKPRMGPRINWRSYRFKLEGGSER